MAETTTKSQTPPARQPATNKLGLTLADYRGLPSTLCDGCGHDAITSQIIKAFWELSIEPYDVVKLSGIGCSSKTPAYFLNRSHGFNSVHGRMPSIATGTHMANKTLTLLGVSGDGDSASIGLGQFGHMIRRNLPVIYIIENNGVYGLTKGQFSATSDRGSTLKDGTVNELTAIDLCGLAIELGCGFVARSFAGDPRQLVSLLKAAVSHNGTAILDVISPCVTFNNHAGSTKSYKTAKEMDTPLHELGFVPFYEQISVDYEEGTVRDVTLHDGSILQLKKLEKDYDPTDRFAADHAIHQSHQDKTLLTGLLYFDQELADFTRIKNLVDTPLAYLGEDVLRPPESALTEIMETLM